MTSTWKKRWVVIFTILAMLVWIPMVDRPAYGETKGSSIKQMVQDMTTREKITQCLMMDFRQWNDSKGKTQDMTVLQDDVAEILAEYKFGSVILFAENIQKTDETVNLTKDMQAAATEKGGLPLLIATDQEGGIVYRLGSGTALPGNMALAATGEQSSATTAGEIIGRELSSVGINTTLAPVIDVNNNPENPVIGLRSFSDDADTVGEYGAKYIDGLDAYNTIGCAKHFPGHGDTAVDSHTGLPEVNKTKAQLMANELKPYKITIDKGIDMIMTAHILYPKLDSTTILSEKTGNEERRSATMSSKILTDLLRGELNFKGVVVTDAMNMEGIASRFTMRQATLESLKAGADIVCMPVTGVHDKAEWTERMEEILAHVENAVADGELSQARLNEAVTRVLTLKQKKGILDYDADDYTTEKALSTVGSDQNRSLERQIAAKAVTVIRNKDNVLPYRMSKGSKVLMLAPYDNEMAQMVMGLNRAKEAGLVPSNVKVKVYNYTEEDFKVKGKLKKAIDWADIVVINSEVSKGERLDYEHWTSAGPKAFTDYCKKKKKKSFVMSVDKPYDVQLYPNADAVIAVYGWKGSSVEITDELLNGDITGDANAFGPNIVAGVEVICGVFGASGKLPVNVPVFDQKTKSYTKKIKYKRGYGLTYGPLQTERRLVKLKVAGTDVAYTGKALKPDLIVKDEKGNTVNQSGYTVKYANNKKVGKASVTVTGRGRYTGTLKGTFKIVPAKASVKSLKVRKKALKVTLTTAPKKLGGTDYQIAYKVKGTKKWKYKTTTKAKLTIKKLRRHKKYQVKARAFKKVKGKTYYGKWSKIQTSKKVK